MGRTQAEDSHHRASQFAKAVASGPVGEILPASVILETKTVNEQIRSGNLNPFNRSEIVICSYQFARSKEPYIRLHERDPRIKADSETIRKSREGNWRSAHLFTLARSRDLYRVYQLQIVNCDSEIGKMLPGATLGQHTEKQTQALQRVPQTHGRFLPSAVVLPVGGSLGSANSRLPHLFDFRVQ